MNKEDWQKGLVAYENIKKQALIDIEIADIMVPAIQKKIEECEEDGK